MRVNNYQGQPLYDHPAGSKRVMLLSGRPALTFLWCPAGRFEMGGITYDGAGAELPHTVVLSNGFWIGNVPVSQSLWKDATGQSFRLSADDESVPVDGVSWDTAVAFCERLDRLLHELGQISSRETVCLPTEAQWEYACRAGTNTSWFFGESESELSDYAWFDQNSNNEAHPVGGKKPNPWGMYDVYGNVSEWCGDCYYAYESGEFIDPIHKDMNDLRIVRGGSYADCARVCSSANRACVSRDNPYTLEIGLRVACHETIPG